MKIALGGWLFDLPLWVEKGPRVVFKLLRGKDLGGDGFSDVIAVSGGTAEGRKMMTRGVKNRSAVRGGMGLGVGVYGA